MPLTGPLARVGEGMLNCAQLALFDSGDDRVILQPYDTEDKPVLLK
ncbi:MAG: hypothetical protein ABT940_07850 [Alphaproteobacteria bacterium]